MNNKKPRLNIIQRLSLKKFQLNQIPKITKMSGADSIENLSSALKKDNLHKVLIVISKTVLNKGLANKFFRNLDSLNILYILYTDVHSDPDITSIEKGFNVYTENGCDGVVAIGGGSVLDFAKVVALRATNPNKTIKQMTNYLCVLKRSAPIYAVPTTAGTGSEITVFAVVTDTANNRKYPIVNDRFIPRVAVLDPKLTLSLPAPMTVYSGMDALTHAIESYISKFSYSFPNHKKMALQAFATIYDNLPKVYKNPNDINARLNMLNASFFAGAACSKTGIGYVHAIAHRLGELYHIQHGQANAIALPYVLSAYMPNIEESLAELAIACKFGTPKDEGSILAKTLITELSKMNKTFGITEGVPEFKEEDLKEIIKRIQNEVKFQGSPKNFSKSEVGKLVLEIVK